MKNHIKIMSYLCLCIIILIGCSVNNTNQVNEIDEEEIIQLFSNTWRDVKDYYGYMDEIKVDWDESYHQHLAKALKSRDKYELYEIYESFLSDINDGHMIVSGIEQWIEDERGILPFQLSWIENGYYVTSKNNDIDIPLLSHLLKIDGEDPLEYLQQNCKVFGSTESSLPQKYIDRFFYDRKGKTITLTFENDGKIIENDYTYQPSTSSFSSKITYFRQPDKSISFTKIQGNSPLSIYDMSNHIIYIYITDFKGSTAQQIENFMKKYPIEEYSYIIDVRDNNGGNANDVLNTLEILSGTKIEGNMQEIYKTSCASNVIEYLSPSQKDLEYAKIGQGMYEGTYFDPFDITDNLKINETLHDNIVVLTNHDTFSASEFFVAVANEMNITTVGEESSGNCGGTVSHFPVTDTISLTFTVGKFILFDGTTLHNKGVLPQNKVSQTIDDAQNEVDTILMEGYKILLDQL